jgi:glycosyltransferase involved in cell wall biosynthesis
MKKVLFISHDASRSGAPIALLSIIKNLKAKNNYSSDILFIRGGDLEYDFMQFTNEYFILSKGRFLSLFERLLNKILNLNHCILILEKFCKCLLRIFEGCQYSGTFNKLKKQNYSLIYVNSAASVGIMSQLKRILSIPAILYVHELEYSIDSIIGHNYFLSQISLFDHFIAASGAVKQNLIENYRIDENRITIAYPFSFNLSPPNRKEQDILDELEIEKDTFIVGSSGSGFWVKGYDIFIFLAYSFFKRYSGSNCVFVWLGKISESEHRNIEYDLKNTGLLGKVKFIGLKENPIDYYNIFDVFTMVSRLDSFSLVCLENAYLSKPLICFDNSGYMPIFIEKDAGFVIPYLDIDCMASKIYLLYNDPILKRKLGINAKKKYINNQFVESSMNQILHCINDTIKDDRPHAGYDR